MMPRPCDEELIAELVRATRDVETAFTVCAHTTRNEHLGAMLLERAMLCGEAARELTAARAAHQHREFADSALRPHGTPDWMALHAALLAHDDASVRDECIRTEDATLVRFRDALEADLPPDFQRIVKRYFAAFLRYRGGLRHLNLPAPDDCLRHPSLRVARRARISRHV